MYNLLHIKEAVIKMTMKDVLARIGKNYLFPLQINSKRSCQVRD